MFKIQYLKGDWNVLGLFASAWKDLGPYALWLFVLLKNSCFLISQILFTVASPESLFNLLLSIFSELEKHYFGLYTVLIKGWRNLPEIKWFLNLVLYGLSFDYDRFFFGHFLVTDSVLIGWSWKMSSLSLTQYIKQIVNLPLLSWWLTHFLVILCFRQSYIILFAGGFSLT